MKAQFEIRDALERVLEAVRRWPAVRVEAGDGGVTQVLHQRGVLARAHSDGLVEIAFPRPVAETLIAAGRAERHHALPDSGWIDTRLSTPADAARLLELLELAREARRPGAAGGGSDRKSEGAVDESVEESFPASDPPAHRSD
jgi:hypothetical protein